MNNESISKSIIVSVAIILGLSILGFFIFRGLKTFSDKDRVVTVKGLAEMNMLATAATIQLNYSVSGDNIQELISQCETKKNAIVAYLLTSGYTKNAIKVDNIDITDRERYYEIKWVGGQQVQEKVARYTVFQSITLQSADVKTTNDKSAQLKLDLVRKDLTVNTYTNYTFPELNSIKPQLIAESTKNARIAGEQFANDSQAKLGKIKTASQGQISIAGEYYDAEGGSEGSQKPSEPYLQKARVVSTIVFFLE